MSSSEAVHGRIAEKTCCSRIRRAISWVYWPPKSRTTTPPSSEFALICASCILAPVVISAPVASKSLRLYSPCQAGVQRAAPLRNLRHDQVQQFVRHENLLYHTLPIDVLRNEMFCHGQCDQFFFRDPRGHFELPANSSVDLYYDFHFFFPGEFGI